MAAGSRAAPGSTARRCASSAASCCATGSSTGRSPPGSGSSRPCSARSSRSAAARCARRCATWSSRASSSRTAAATCACGRLTARDVRGALRGPHRARDDGGRPHRAGPRAATRASPSCAEALEPLRAGATALARRSSTTSPSTGACASSAATAPWSTPGRTSSAACARRIVAAGPAVAPGLATWQRHAVIVDAIADGDERRSGTSCPSTCARRRRASRRAPRTAPGRGRSSSRGDRRRACALRARSGAPRRAGRCGVVASSLDSRVRVGSSGPAPPRARAPRGRPPRWRGPGSPGRSSRTA